MTKTAIAAEDDPYAAVSSVVRQLIAVKVQKVDDLEDLRTLGKAVNGFLYHGDRLEAVVETVKQLRADPMLALRLIFPGGNHDLEWGVHSYQAFGGDGWFVDWRQRLVREAAAPHGLTVYVRDTVDWETSESRRRWPRYIGPWREAGPEPDEYGDDD